MHSILLVLLLGQVPAGELSIKTGDLEVTMASKAAWTITSVTFGSDKVILPMGGQGAVLAIRGGGWVGSAMKADSEQVAELSVTADGQPVTLSLPQVVTGQKVTVIKVSALASLKHTAETTFEQEGFVQHHAFEAIDDMTVTNLYAFIYSLWPQAKQWIAQPLAGERVQGEFAASKGNKPNQPVRWLAQYDPAMQKGVVAYFREPFQGKGAFHSFWDNKGYHKLFAQPATGLIAKGTKFDLTMVIRFFASPPADWEKKVQDVAQAIEQQVPPVAAPSSQSPGERLYGPDVPESGTLTLKTATYAVPMCAQRAWTIQKIEYDGKTVAHERGFYGTVMIPKNGNWWGTGHTQGGKEIVNSLKLTVDGKQQPVEIDTTVTGRKLTLLKASTIWKFKCAAEVTVTEDHVFERTQLEATEDVDLKLLYYFMHCFIPTTTTWIAELPDGSLAEGILASDGGFQVNKDTRWVAQFEPTMNLGFLCYSPKVISGPGGMSKIWDLDARRYHKFYYQANGERSFKRGEKLDYSVIVQMVPQETGDWKATKAAVQALKNVYPPQ